MSDINAVPTHAAGRSRLAGSLAAVLLATSVPGSATETSYRWVEQVVVGDISFRGIAVLDRNVAWVTGTGGAVYRTEDGGDTWQAIDVPGAAEGSRVAWPRDRGLTGHIAQTPMLHGSRTRGIFSIDFFDEQTGIAVGGDYTRETAGSDNVIPTTHGGRSWELAPRRG